MRVTARISTMAILVGVVAPLLIFQWGCGTEAPISLSAPPPQRAATVADPKVVLFVIDGPRLSETFDDPSHTHIPNLWNQLRPLGTRAENFRNKGLTKSVSGHAAMLTGTWQTLNNEGLENPDRPTLFEYYRQAKSAPASDAVLVGGKQKLAADAYSTDGSYGASYGAQVDVGFSSDFETYSHVISALQADQPHFIMASFSQVDTRAHSGVWQDYVDQIAIVDSLALSVWNYLQGDPFYQNQTWFFLTADHGRHIDANGGFQGHGDSCEGCQRLPFLVIGPGIRQGVTLPVQYAYSQRDLCKTIGSILDVATPQAEGVVMHDIFEWATTAIPATVAREASRR